MKLFHEWNEEKLRQIRHDPYFTPCVEANRKKAEEYLKNDPPRILFSQIHRFVTDGNRVEFQRVYENYQHRMEVFFLLYLIDEDERYLSALSDILWNICDFESWSIPAHVSETFDPARRRINLDLCSTILAARVAEILYFIGDKLPDIVRRRAQYEVRLRLIDSYRDYDDYGWMRGTNNWAAVCIGATLTAYLYAATPEEIEAQLPRMIRTAEGYLDGFDDEGCCAEGYGYWHYGFSFFCLFASMLRDYTDGEIDFFEREKVHRIALFQQNMAMNEREAISFSDCSVAFSPSAWLSHFLKKQYPDIEIPPLPVGTGPALRSVAWCEPEFADCHMEPKSHIYHAAQWFIHRGGAYTLAIKAGYNNESHNHNDVGSFLISQNGKVSFCDPGGGEYTRQYFGTERYDLLACSSRGHSVPIINGEYQVVGEERSVVDVEKPDEYAFTMQNAYRVATLERLRRHVVCEAGGVRMTDSYLFSEKPETLVERFVSMQKPEDLGGGRVRVGDTVLRYDPALFSLSFGEEGLRRSPERITPIYFTDLSVIAPTERMEFSFFFA